MPCPPSADSARWSIPALSGDGLGVHPTGSPKVDAHRYSDFRDIGGGAAVVVVRSGGIGDGERDH